MDYKKIIKSQKTRFFLLNMLSWIPNKTMIKLQYKLKLNRKLDLKNPRRYTEWIQWYKLYYRNPIMHDCVDKYNVREYVISKGLNSILNELYGVYNNPDEIDFESLPEKFVIKTTSGGGGQNILICDDKSKFDYIDAKKKLSYWLSIKTKKSLGREWAYEDVKNKIIIEKYLDGNDEKLSGINDFKFFCYNGQVRYIVFDGDRYIEHKRNFYDSEWNYIDVSSDCDSFGDCIPKPKNLSKLIRISEKLSEDFPFVRVDLYNINGKIYFGELTFYPWSGYVQYTPDEFDFELGKYFDFSRNGDVYEKR